MRGRALALLVVLVAFAYLHGAPHSRAWRPSSAEDMPQPLGGVEVPDPPQSIEELRTRIAKILAAEHVAGAAIALVDRNGPIWVGGVGVRDRATRAPVEADTAFRVGSVSKSVIALGVMKLVDQGKLDLDRPLREILPGVFENPWEAVAPVTLAQCLEHTAGFDDLRFNEVFAPDEEFPVTSTLALNPRSRIVRWQPGTRHGYSNVGYTVAARAIEVASGEPFDVYIRREILAPLGITDADFRRTSVLAPRLASGYMGSDEPIVFRPFAHRPAGALLASAADLGKLVHFWIVRGEGYPPIVSRAGLERIEHSGTLPYPRVDGEYGFASYGDVMHPVITRGHDGGMPGFHASFRYEPERGVGYVLLLNSNYVFRGYFQLRALLFAYLTRGEQFQEPDLVPAPATEHPGARYFALGNPRNELFGFMDRVRSGWTVDDRGDHLHVTELSGETFEIVPTPDGGYRFPNQCGSTLRFTTNADGTPVMLMSFLYAEADTGWFAHLRYVALGLALVMIRLAPMWAAAMLVLGLLRPRGSLPASLALWPAIAGLCLVAVPHLMDTAFFAGVIGEVHPLTVTICGATLLFAFASVATLVSTVRWTRRPDRPSLLALVIPMLCGLAFSSLALWLGANGWIGLRTWAW